MVKATPWSRPRIKRRSRATGASKSRSGEAGRPHPHELRRRRWQPLGWNTQRDRDGAKRRLDLEGVPRTGAQKLLLGFRQALALRSDRYVEKGDNGAFECPVERL